MADTRDRGALDSTDFAIGMYFIRGLMSNKFSSIPTSLPPGLYHQAGGGQEHFGPVKALISGNSDSFRPVVDPFQEHTGRKHFLQPDVTKQRSSSQVADIQNSPKELIAAEGDLISLRVEKDEIEGAFLRDKEETKKLHKRIFETGKQVEALKADVERLKKDAKRQKGLLAIARKQLSTIESEKDKAEREHAEAVEELSSITRNKDTVDAELELALVMTSPEPKVAQHTLSSNSLASQPFERLAMSSLLLQRSPSIQDSSVSSTEPTSLPPSTTNDVSLELPGSDLLPASDTSFDSFSAVQTTASPKSSQRSDDLHIQSVLSPAAVDGADYFMTPSGAFTSAEHDASLTHPKERFSSLGKLPDSHDKLKKPQTRAPHFKLAVRPI